jgi:hypothetical protein
MLNRLGGRRGYLITYLTQQLKKTKSYPVYIFTYNILQRL